MDIIQKEIDANIIRDNINDRKINIDELQQEYDHDEPTISDSTDCITDDRDDVIDNMLLCETYRHHGTPKGFKTKLLLHQRTILAAMLDIEEKREIRCADTITKTCAGQLSEKFGSGKTIMILALLTAKPMPKNGPIYQVCRYNGRNNSRYDESSSFQIEKSFHSDNVLKPALIFVASSVVLQWKKAIEDFTNFRVFSIASVYDIKKLYIYVENGTINEYDIVLVKNGTITGEFKFDGYVEDKNKKRVRKIYSIIANLTRFKCWSRVIFDDYDIIKLPRPTSFMNGLFTWFISATNFDIWARSNDIVEHDNLHDILSYHNVELRILSKSTLLIRTFNVCNTDKYTEDSISVGKPMFWSHVLVNKNKKYVQMIGAMAGDKAKEIMEMLNGDAIETAAEHAGIISNNITDIFKKILQDQYNKYALSVDILEWINTLDIPGFAYLNEPDDEDVYYQKHVYEKRPIEYKYPDIKGKVENVQHACIIDKEESGKAIERVKDNIKEGDCPVCCGDLNDDDAIIVKCCGKILCADCGIQGTNLARRDSSITGKCPNCRSLIGFTDLIFINGDFDLDNILSQKCVPGEDNKVEVTNEKKDLTKFDILLKIINGEDLPNKIQKNVAIKGMLVGIKDLPEAPKEHRKVIIFSKFEESLNDIDKKMRGSGLRFKRLGGTAAQIHGIATEFQDSYEGINVLLINGEKYASGLNLQSATDLVFMHKIVDRNIESQIIGRIQRLGRTYKAHIHYILYDDELRYMGFN